MAYETPTNDVSSAEYKLRLSGPGIYVFEISGRGDYALAEGEAFWQSLVTWLASQGHAVTSERIYTTHQGITP
ncbi:hypothetical protein [Nonomuraea candida]|uniref:hypothetical protein n=1 Tax=Nonomuraea candida TaxID=359159 RepID=UPI0005BB70ED|nr:hypothetical protein [Nonomuraea candida]